MSKKTKLSAIHTGYSVKLTRRKDGTEFFASGPANTGGYSTSFFWKRKAAVKHKQMLIENGLGPCKVVRVSQTVEELP